MAVKPCENCHHTPSGRYGGAYGAECYCPCHDVADAAVEAAAREKLLRGEMQRVMDAALAERDRLLTVLKAGMQPNALHCLFSAQADDPCVCCCGKPKAYHWKAAAAEAVAKAESPGR